MLRDHLNYHRELCFPWSYLNDIYSLLLIFAWYKDISRLLRNMHPANAEHSEYVEHSAGACGDKRLLNPLKCGVKNQLRHLGIHGRSCATEVHRRQKVPQEMGRSMTGKIDFDLCHQRVGRMWTACGH